MFPDESRCVRHEGLAVREHPGAGNAGHHDPAVTEGYRENLPERVRAHLHRPVVDELTPIPQEHTVEGLVTGEARGTPTAGRSPRGC